MELDLRALAAVTRAVAAGDEAALRPARIAAVLPALFGAAHCVAIDWARASAVPRRLRPADLRFVNWSPGLDRHYFSVFRERDPISRWLTSREGRRGPRVVRLSDLVARRNLVRTDFFREMLQPSGLQHVLTLAVRVEDRLIADYSIVRPGCARDFSDAEMDLASAVLPLLEASHAAQIRSAGSVPSAAPLRAATGEEGRSVMLTPREEEVAALAASGLSNKEIARRLRVSPLTVKNQLKSVFRKCDASNRTEMGAKLFR